MLSDYHLTYKLSYILKIVEILATVSKALVTSSDTFLAVFLAWAAFPRAWNDRKHLMNEKLLTHKFSLKLYKSDCKNADSGFFYLFSEVLFQKPDDLWVKTHK